MTFVLIVAFFDWFKTAHNRIGLPLISLSANWISNYRTIEWGSKMRLIRCYENLILKWFFERKKIHAISNNWQKNKIKCTLELRSRLMAVKCTINVGYRRIKMQPWNLNKTPEKIWRKSLQLSNKELTRHLPWWSQLVKQWTVTNWISFVWWTETMYSLIFFKCFIFLSVFRRTFRLDS